jgi:uncharacterized protein YjbI with pentapeptide repeats
MDLSGTQTEYSQEFKGLNLRGGLVEQKEFNACTFVKCSFRETIFRSCEFRDCVFRGCDLSLANLKGCVFKGTLFEDSQVIAVNWTETAWGKSKFLRPVDFSGCVLNHSTFMGLDLKKIKISRCIARDVDFSDANLTQADCTQTDFSGSRFLHTNLSEADFSGASNYSIAANLNTLKKTKFSLPEAMSLLHGLDIILTDEQ